MPDDDNSDPQQPDLPSTPPPKRYGPESGEDVDIPQPSYTPGDLHLLGLDSGEEYPAELLEARTALEVLLAGQVEERSGVQSKDNLNEITNIQGVGIGRARPSEYLPRHSEIVPGQPTLAVYLAEPRHADDVESVIVERMGIRAAASRRVPVVPVVTGLIKPLSHTSKVRPAPGGFSIGNAVPDPNTGTKPGTIACLATGRSAPRNQRTLLLSCNHVIANTNLGQFGDCIIQPGVDDGGTCLNDQIAILERKVFLNFTGGINLVDAATAWAQDPALVSRKIGYVANGSVGTFPISTTTAPAVKDMVVAKSGRTTMATVGVVREVAASHLVCSYGGGGLGGFCASFTGSIAIEANIAGTLFSTGGDSGSLVWTYEAQPRPVGLLFAQEGARSFANRIDNVTSALDIFLIA